LRQFYGADDKNTDLK